MPETRDRPDSPSEDTSSSSSQSDDLSSDISSSSIGSSSSNEKELIQVLPPIDVDQSSLLFKPMDLQDRVLEPISEKSNESEEQLKKDNFIEEPVDNKEYKLTKLFDIADKDQSLPATQKGQKDTVTYNKANITENKNFQKQDNENEKNVEDSAEEVTLKTVSFSGTERKDLEQMAQKKTEASRTEKRTSQWEELMRKFSEAHKEECKTVSLDIPRAQRSIKQFPTGSTYEGTWDLLGMSGYGTYTFPNGVVYMGDFDDGMFHGEGELQYPDGAILRGTWRKGHMVDKTLLFADGLEYCDEDWNYCKQPDRRFALEYDNGLQPSGKTYLTADQPTKEIPRGYYDTGDGFYDPKTKIVYSADNITDIVRSAGPLEAKWIVENCRTNPDEAVGPRADLYEEWSEPQTDPEPTPPPPVTTRASNRRETAFSEDFNEDLFYEILRKSRTSCAAARSFSYSDRAIKFYLKSSTSFAKPILPNF